MSYLDVVVAGLAPLLLYLVRPVRLVLAGFLYLVRLVLARFLYLVRLVRLVLSRLLSWLL